jgi:hypothetical protein
MGKKLKAEGDTWRAVPGGPAQRAGYRTIVFLCESNGQRPYRVAEVPAGEADGDALLDRLSARELGELFDASASLGAPAS